MESLFISLALSCTWRPINYTKLVVEDNYLSPGHMNPLKSNVINVLSGRQPEREREYRDKQQELNYGQ